MEKHPAHIPHDNPAMEKPPATASNQHDLLITPFMATEHTGLASFIQQLSHLMGLARLSMHYIATALLYGPSFIQQPSFLMGHSDRHHISGAAENQPFLHSATATLMGLSNLFSFVRQLPLLKGLGRSSTTLSHCWEPTNFLLYAQF